MTQEKFNEMMNTWLAEQAHQPATWELADMNWAVEQGFVKGDLEGKTAPKKFITRGEMITVLRRYADKLATAVKIGGNANV